MEVTASGVPRPRRSQLAQLVERLRGTWSGALNVGCTAAVVVEGPQAELDWAAPKLVVALQHGIPVVSADWLLDSQAHGFLLSTERYRLEPPPPGRRSSAASTSAAAGPPRPALTAATVNQAAATALPPAQPQRPATPGSPAAVELEVLRGEVLQLRHSPLPLQRSPQAQAAAPTPTSKPLVVPDELQEALPSPEADVPLQYAVRGSPALPGSPLQLLGQTKSEQESGGHSAAVLPSFSLSSSREDEAGFGGSPAWSGGSPGSPDSRVGTVGAAVTPAPPSAGTDSDTKIARFLSRRPMVTLARGSCLPRRCMLPDSSSSDSSAGSCSSNGTSIRSSLSGSGSGSAERMEGRRRFGEPASLGPHGVIPCSSRTTWPEGADGQDEPATAASPPSRQPTDQQQPGSAGTRAAVAVRSPESVHAGTLQRGFAPAAPGQQHARGQSLLRMEPPVAEGRLPATTLVRLGQQLHRPPLRSTWEGLLERHGCGSEDPSSSLPPVTFHVSAEALLEEGAAINSAAGDERHGAVMLYDIREDGSRVYALALVQAIYRWHDEVWMEHRYLLTREDLQERPSWAAALQGLEMRPGEVLLTLNSYHSPMHLVAGDFSLSFPGRAQRARRAQQGQHKHSRGVAAHGSAPAVYTCRRGFDTGAGTVVPLRRALEGFGGAQG